MGYVVPYKGWVESMIWIFGGLFCFSIASCFVSADSYVSDGRHNVRNLVLRGKGQFRTNYNRNEQENSTVSLVRYD